MSDELWDAVKARQTVIRESEGVRKVRASRFWEHRRSQHLLTGLVYCGSCGSRLAAVGRDYWPAPPPAAAVPARAARASAGAHSRS